MASSAKRVSKYRENLRVQGLKPVQIWVYDTDNPEFQRRMDEWMRWQRDNRQEQVLLEQLEHQLAETEGWVWDEEI